ncbi:MAG: hypothetical protein ACK5MK_03830 [Dysgonomonas sp.]
MKYILGLVVIVLMFVSCRNNKEPQTVTEEPAFEALEDTVISIEFKESQILLPFGGNLVVSKKLKPDTLFTHIRGIDNFTCGKDYLLYIPFPNKNEYNIIAVPMKCDGYTYRYVMLSVLRDSVISSLFIESELLERGNKKNMEVTSFEINKDYQFKVTTMDQKNNSHFFDYKTYQINDQGIFEVVPEQLVTTNSKCFRSNSNVSYPIVSDDLLSLDYSIFTCSNIEGMKNYDCHDGINYLTLKKTDDDKYYVLIYSECGDFSYADLLVIQNGRVISGLTIDTATYDDGNSENLSGEETTFAIDEDMSIHLTHTIIKRGDAVSASKESYKISKDGRFVKV